MYNGKSVAVIVPCYNEERHIREVVETLPYWVDLIVAIDDASEDKTIEVLDSLRHENPKLSVLVNPRNLGVGGSTEGLVTRYSFEKSEPLKTEHKVFISAITTGDLQQIVTLESATETLKVAELMIEQLA